LRIAVDDSKSKCRFNTKFGCKPADVEELLNIAKTLKLDVCGFSFHVGSGCSSADSFYEALSDCRKAADMAKSLGIQVSIIDIGGGFPGSDSVEIRFDSIAHSVNRGIRDFFGEEFDGGVIQFIAEPGRYFAQGSHTLVLNVIGKKTVTDEATGEKINMYYLNESVYGSFNCIANDHYLPTILPFNERDQQMQRSKLFGTTCDSIDVINEDIMLPELAIGECVYVEKIGAYTIAAASAFNGFAPTNTYKYIFKSSVQ
jgi:ornithine decarboxylase